MAKPDPSYDFASLVPAGIIVQRALIEGLARAYAANGFRPLSPAQIRAVTGPSPAYPASLPRFADSNPEPLTNAPSNFQRTVVSP